MSQSPNINRNINPSNAISAPPSQLSISADAPSLHQPVFSGHGYGVFPPPPTSPANPRKRRASGSLGSGSLIGSSASTFADPEGFIGGARDIDLSTQSPPVAKKGRTNTPWTPAEEQRLKTMRDAGNSWSEIAK
ncbi:hypothetical protein LTR39_004539, partial [Cryomyces antarcticus]